MEAIQKLLHENEENGAAQNESEDPFGEENVMMTGATSGSQPLVLVVDVEDLSHFPGTQTLVQDILDNVDIALKCLRDAVNEVVSKTLNITTPGNSYVDVRLTPTRRTCEMSKLSGSDCGKYVLLAGTVVKAYQARPALLSGCYVCRNCGIEMRLQPNGGLEPSRCPQCQRVDVLSLQMAKSAFEDVQRVRLQDDAGGAFRAIDAFLHGNHCGALRPGDKILASGFLSSTPISHLTQHHSTPLLKSVAKGFSIGILKSGMEVTNENSRESNREASLRQIGAQNTPGAYAETGAKRAREIRLTMVFQVVQIEIAANSSMGDSESTNPVSRAAQATPSSVSTQLRLQSALAKLSGRPERLISSYLRAVQGLNDVKHALLLQRLGGVPKRTADGSRLRADINILLVGDAAVGKSLVLRQAARAAGRGVYVSGGAASVAGLTAAVTKDPAGGGWALEAGALARADGGVCCIDDFHRVNFSDQSALHEAMEQQSITLAKAGVTATLRARAPVLAACAPVNGVYDRLKPLRRNVAVSAALLSRFDLVFVLTDEFDAERDGELAKQLLDVVLNAKGGPELSADEINAYIEACKGLRPVLSSEAQHMLQETWVKLRQDDLREAGLRDHRITVRQLESLIRLSEAQAKLERSPQVTAAHVQTARDLVAKCVVDVVLPKEVFEVREEELPRHSGAENEAPETARAQESVDKSRTYHSISEERQQVEISVQDLRRLIMALRFAVYASGREDFQGYFFLEMARAHIPLDQYNLTEMQRNDIYRQVFERFLYTERWVAEEAAGEVEGEEEGDGPDAYLRKTYFFTYLAPEV